MCYIVDKWWYKSTTQEKCYRVGLYWTNRLHNSVASWTAFQNSRCRCDALIFKEKCYQRGNIWREVLSNPICMLGTKSMVFL
jgi:hypothetical protein